jgi:5-methylcytosine-specific restriction enzyme A
MMPGLTVGELVERLSALRLHWSPARPKVSVDVLRLESARRAVLLRSEGHCESPGCTGEPRDITDAGHAIVEVDHIQDLAKGGPDHPSR